jgi:predicted lipid-binding transport protein (Tim44 family)
MTPGRRRALVAALMTIAAIGMIFAPEALAAGGSGSSGFGGGGGGGGGIGGGGEGGGRGVGLYILFQLLFRIAIIGHGLGALVLLGLFVIWTVIRRGGPRAGSFWSARRSYGRANRGRTADRERRVALAAAEAAEEDPAFAPDVVKPAASRLFTDVQAAWDADDRPALSRLVAPDLLAEWERRLDGLARRGWRNRVQPAGEPRVGYVGLTRRGNIATDRVVVRIEAKLRDYVEDRAGNHIKRTGRISETTRIREYWTLGRRGSRWILVSIEHGGEGSHALDERIVATPWSDEQGLRDEALMESAVADAVPSGTSIAEVADLQFDGDAHAAALDLSVADGRFAPDVLEIAARRAVAAWAEAVDGDDAQLNAIAHRGAARELLHPGDPSASTRLVVRGPQVRQIRIVGLDAGATPPTMSIEVDLTGRRYIEDRSSAMVIAGSQTRAANFTEQWTFALDGPPAQPWRLVAAGASLAQA